MAVYNAEKYIKESVDSILSQTYTNFEFIIIDDCSTDSSNNLLNDLALQDNRIKIIANEENLGLTKNLNKACKIARGEYIARMDADDISFPDRFEKQVMFLDNNPEIDIVGSFSNDINEEGTIIGSRSVPISHTEIVSILPKLNPMSHPTVMFRKTRLEQIGFYNENFRTSQDYELWFRAVGNGLKLANIPEVLFSYRMNDNYVARKSMKYRMNEYRLRLEGYKYINIPNYKYIYAIIPVILGIIPPFLYKILKKMDKR